MPVVSPDQLVKLQRNSEEVRNICILAHVDHGKTSLTDALLATNGIISPKLAGKIRYLDSRPDEQLRGITMESSAISLYFSMMRRSQPDIQPVRKEYLVNLIDSPGHIDFSSEVSTASRLCDGAVVLVDAVEGVCSQTVTVLRHTWTEHLQPLLVINKIDRLVTELRMSAAEAYTHLSKLLEQVNAIVGSFFQGERMEEDLKWREKVEDRIAAAAARQQEKVDKTDGDEKSQRIDDEKINGTYEERDDEDIYFAPEKNNVIFSSAVDGWAFTVKQFAALYEKKLGIKRSVLEKVLWGDFYLEPKTMRVLGNKHLKGRSLKPMFVQLVLENIWAVYEATVGGDQQKGDQTKLEKITKSLSINLPLHILKSKDRRAAMTAIFSSWLPLSTALLVSVIEHLPSPPVAQATRMPSIIDSSPGATAVDPRIRDALTKSHGDKDTPVVAYVSKMVAVKESDLPRNQHRKDTLSPEEARALTRKKRAEIARAQNETDQTASQDPIDTVTDSLQGTSLAAHGEGDEVDKATEVEQEREHLIGFARLYSGTLSVGDEVFVLPPKFSPENPGLVAEPKKAKINALYLLMGRELEPLSAVPAGVVFGIEGLEGHILKSGTICSQVAGAVNLAGIGIGSQPIVRVALEPTDPGDLDKMITGLKMLEQSDPCAEYEVLESGEHVILTAGELHLERCLKDLRERFAQCDIQPGEPIVPYRESIISADEMAPAKDKDLPRGTVHAIVLSKQIEVRLRVRPLPNSITKLLGKSSQTIRQIQSEQRPDTNLSEHEDQEQLKEKDDIDEVISSESIHITKDQLQNQLRTGFGAVRADKQVWQNAAERIAAFGPKRVGPNLLIDSTKDRSLSKVLGDEPVKGRETSTNGENGAKDLKAGLSARDLSGKIAHAFQLFTAQGPLCNEPVQGIAVFVEEVIVQQSTEGETSLARENQGRITGEVIKTVRDSIRQGFLDWSPRLLLAMYSCEIQASTEVLGRVYGVITRRRGRILSEMLKEGTPFFTILSVLPVAESFGFSDEIRTRTSGAASPQLIFQGFEMLDQDPFWVPFTEEEIEDLGELADKENVAKRYMDAVRKRKGLFVKDKKLVVNAEKQKTLKR